MDVQNTEQQAVKRTRDDIRARMSEKYPDRNFEADEDLDDGIYGAFDEYEAQNKELTDANAKYKENEDALTGMFSANPASANFLNDMAEGNDPVMGLIDLYGVDAVRDMLDDPEKKQEIADKHKKFLEDSAKEKELQDAYDANIEATLDAEAQAVESGEMTQEELDKAHEAMKIVYEMIITGKWTAQDLKNVLKGVNYDADVEQAAQEAEVRGKNAQIVEKKKARQAGDGMPNMGGGGASRRPANKADQSNLGALGRQRRSMWD